MDNSSPLAFSQRLTRLWQQPAGVALLLGLTLLLGGLAWWSNLSLDLTHNRRNTLSTSSLHLLQQMPATIHVQAYCSNSPYKGRYFRKSIQSLVQRYQRHHPQLVLEFVDPVTEPARARALQVKKEGELVVSYQGQQAHMYLPYTEEALSNLLMGLKHGQAAPLIFIEGQGEAALGDDSASGASQLKQAMQAAGIPTLQAHALADAHYPSSHTLVLAGASQPYLPEFVSNVRKHVQQGGNLVWLVDTAESVGLQSLASHLGIDISHGMAIDPANRVFDIAPHELASQHYAHLGATQDFALRTFFSESHRISATRDSQPYWKVTPLIAVADEGWLSARYQTNQRHVPNFNPATDVQGPVTVALSLEHARADGSQQRVLVIGSRRFLQNSQQARGGNQAMAIKLLQWVRNSQPVLSIQTRPLRDSIVVLPQSSPQNWGLFTLFNGAQFLLPILLCLAAWRAWNRRKV